MKVNVASETFYGATILKEIFEAELLAGLRKIFLSEAK